jgi:hypothetical protein
MIVLVVDVLYCGYLAVEFTGYLDETACWTLCSKLNSMDPSDAAKALNRAVLCLREDPSVTVDRWAPFMHFGI